ncbi:arylsulfatase [Brachyspira pilosicoli]|uniref:arylsulfatase n=1 Tax=Brachyspira pilosicoli TaxID=52584 RepID=UPI0012F6C7C6|nr:arylsulfatase [Brachyspira pilosicoli]
MTNKFKKGFCFGTSLMVAASAVSCSTETQSEKPNIVYIVLDDMGFGDLGCYGSSISTPNIDALANNGIRYVNYFTSPLSSPSRASLLTGCEANKVGMGVVSDVDFGELAPNITGRIKKEHAPFTHTLQANGYNTYAIGKWHLGPYDEFTPDGDKYHWPSGKGFDKNYNFVASQANQNQPGGMIEGDEFIVPDTSDPNYHLSQDIVDKTLEYIDESKNEPFFAYVAFGAMHGPFNVAKKYIDKYKGKFDHGWDVEREKIFERQKELGIMPADAVFSPRNEDVPAWDSLTDKEKAVAARHMETYAGFLEHTDEQIGRLILEMKKRGVYDNTIFVVVSDNGANYNGGRNGSLMAHANENLYVHDIDTQYNLMDEFGSAVYGTEYNMGWANVSNTPLRYFKTKAHYGGVKTFCIASWANGIADKGRISKEMIAVFDISPTMLDVLGFEPLTEVNGVKQEKMQGISFKESFESSAPMTNPRKEIALMMMLDRTYADGSGYIIVTNPKTQEWELYDINNDPTQMKNLASSMPDKVKEMAAKYEESVKRDFNGAQNLLIDFAHRVDSKILIERYGQLAKDVLTSMQTGKAVSKEAEEYMRLYKFFSFVPEGIGYAGVGSVWYRPPSSKLRATNYTYKKDDGYFFSLSAAHTGAVSHNINVDIEIDDNSKGVIYANGGLDGGYALYVNDDGNLVYEYNYLGERQKVISPAALSKGNHNIMMSYKKDNVNSGVIDMIIDGNAVASSTIKMLPIMISYDYFSIGEDVGSKVSLDYKDNYAFNGKVGDVNINLGDDLLK